MKENLVKEYLLENEDVLISVVHELNSWNRCLDWLDFWVNDGEFFELFYSGKNGLEIARAIYYGDYRYNDDYVRINGYGNLVSYTGYEMIEVIKDYIDEIVENLIKQYDNLYLSDDIKEIFEEAEEEEE